MAELLLTDLQVQDMGQQEEVEQVNMDLVLLAVVEQVKLAL
jgi:hypothetical protein